MHTAQEEALKLINDLKRVMPPGSELVAKLRQNFDRLTTEIETLKSAHGMTALPGCFAEYPGITFTPAEQDCFATLKRAGGRGIEKYGILTAIYASRPDNSWPEVKIVDIWVCRIRAKFYEAGYTNPIETVWGRGYKFANPVKSDAFEETYSSARTHGITRGRPPNPVARPQVEGKTFEEAAAARAKHGIWKKRAA